MDHSTLGLEDADWEIAENICEGILSEAWEKLTAKEKIDRLFEVFKAWTSDQPLEGFNRVYVNDPFGNRIELMELQQNDGRKDR